MKVLIDNHELKVNGVAIAELPKLHYASEVFVYSVPEVYRESGVFYSVRRIEPKGVLEIPASESYSLIDTLHLEPHEDAVLSQAKKEVLEQVIAEADELLKSLEAGCAEREVKTWDQQAIEAAATGSESDQALVDSIALYRGLDSGELINRINAKSAQYKAAAGAIIGAKQYVEDRIDEAESLEQLFSVATIQERLHEVAA